MKIKWRRYSPFIVPYILAASRRTRSSTNHTPADALHLSCSLQFGPVSHQQPPVSASATPSENSHHAAKPDPFCSEVASSGPYRSLLRWTFRLPKYESRLLWLYVLTGLGQFHCSFSFWVVLDITLPCNKSTL
ncbi:uncharacterized protein J3R85_020839 [Psidium guajava]|nr:uncharacterized protein J3R85_020839 [Psidium guajava]